MDDHAALRIGEVSRRTGVAVATLRAWERRYGLLEPERTEGGHRRYGDADLQRVRRMQQLLDDGWGADAAARQAREEALRTASATAPPPTAALASGGAEELIDHLSLAFRHLDTTEANDAIDEVFARLDPPAALDHVLMPALRVVGDGWETDPGAIAREHFASNTIRPRLLRLVRTPASLVAPRTCVAAAPEHEEHDLGVLASAVVAAHAGFAVRFLGARTPTGALLRAAEATRADVVLVGAVRRGPAQDFLDEAAPLVSSSVVLGGAGFRPEDVLRLDGRAVLHSGPYAALPDTLRRALAL